jgi:hypothetical protein
MKTSGHFWKCNNCSLSFTHKIVQKFISLPFSHLVTHPYRRPTLFEGLLFAVLIIHGLIFVTKNVFSTGFTLIILGFSLKLLQKITYLTIKVLPYYPRFWYSRDFPRSRPPQITRPACISIIFRLSYKHTSFTAESNRTHSHKDTLSFGSFSSLPTLVHFVKCNRSFKVEMGQGLIALQLISNKWVIIFAQ